MAGVHSGRNCGKFFSGHGAAVLLPGGRIRRALCDRTAGQRKHHHLRNGRGWLCCQPAACNGLYRICTAVSFFSGRNGQCAAGRYWPRRAVHHAECRTVWRTGRRVCHYSVFLWRTAGWTVLQRGDRLGQIQCAKARCAAYGLSGHQLQRGQTAVSCTDGPGRVRLALLPFQRCRCGNG